MFRKHRSFTATLAATLAASTLGGTPAAAQDPPTSEAETSIIDPLRVEFVGSGRIRLDLRGDITFGTSAGNDLWPDHFETVYRVGMTDVLPADEAFTWLGEADDPGWVTGLASNTAGGSLRVPFAMGGVQSQVLDDDHRVDLRLAEVEAPDGGAYSLYETPTWQIIDSHPDLHPATPVGDLRTGTGTQGDGSPQEAPDGGWVNLNDTVGIRSIFRPEEIPTSLPTTHRFTAEGLYCITYDVRFEHQNGETIERSVLVRYAVGDEVDAGAECGATPGDGGPTVPVTAGDPPTTEEGEDGVVYLRSGHVDGFLPILHGLDEGDPSLELAGLRGSSTTGSILSYDDVVVVLDDRALNALPDDETADDWSFLGEPGSRFWLNDRGGAYQSNWPWVGLSSEHPSIHGVLDRGLTDIQVRLDAVTGRDGQPAPGTFAIWGRSPTDHQWVPTAELPISRRLDLGSHVHQNWGFTEPGVYCATLSAELNLDDGRRVSDRGQLTWVVGNEIDYRDVVPCSRTQDTPDVPIKDLAPASSSTVEAVDGTTSIVPSVQDGRLLIGLHKDDPTGLSQGTARSIDDTLIVPAVRMVGETYAVDGLLWNQTRVRPEDVEGDIAWRIVDVHGPGELSTVTTGRGGTGHLVFDLNDGLDETMLWPGGASSDGVRGTAWTFSAPGVYCVAMEWEATPIGAAGPLVEQHVATVVVDPAGDAEVSETCAGTSVGDGARSAVPEAAALSLDAGEVVAGDEVTVAGSGFLTDEVVELTLADHDAAETTGGDGGFETVLVAPTAVGAHTIASVGRTSGRTATVELTVIDADDPEPAPVPFTDVSQSNPHREAIAELAQRGITVGRTATTYDPGGSVSRGQLASFIARSLGLEDRPADFDDVGAGSVHAGAIGALVEAGWAEGFEDGTFRPWLAVPRDQVAAVLARLLELEQVDGADRFSDLDSTSHRDAINALADAEVVVGAVDGTYGPHDQVQRDQFASLLWRTLQGAQS